MSKGHHERKNENMKNEDLQVLNPVNNLYHAALYYQKYRLADGRGFIPDKLQRRSRYKQVDGKYR